MLKIVKKLYLSNEVCSELFSMHFAILTKLLINLKNANWSSHLPLISTFKKIIKRHMRLLGNIILYMILTLVLFTWTFIQYLTLMKKIYTGVPPMNNLMKLDCQTGKHQITSWIMRWITWRITRWIIKYITRYITGLTTGCIARLITSVY